LNSKEKDITIAHELVHVVYRIPGRVDAIGERYGAERLRELDKMVEEEAEKIVKEGIELVRYAEEILVHEKALKTQKI